MRFWVSGQLPVPSRRAHETGAGAKDKIPPRLTEEFYYIMGAMLQRYEILVIGGGVAGTTAAETIRKHEPYLKIAILENEPHPLYSRVFLPAYARDEIDLGHVFLRRLDDYAQKDIDIYFPLKVMRIDFSSRRVEGDDGRSFSYQKLLIASGGQVEPWEFERGFQDKILRLQTLEDAERLRSRLKGKKIRQALVVGGGFITLEFLNIFYKYGVQVTLLLRDEFFWKGHVDEVGGEFFTELFSRHGVTLLAPDEIYKIQRGGEGLEVRTKNDRKISCDFIAAGLGLHRNSELAQGVLDTDAGIRVNEFLEARALSFSSQNGEMLRDSISPERSEGGSDGRLQVWAAGDVAEYFDEFSQRWKVVGNWTHGFLSGHAAGLNMLGQKKRFQLVPTYSIKALGSVVTFLGEVEERYAGATLRCYEPQGKKYIRFFLKDEKLIGAVLFNAYKEKPLLAKWIETRKDLSHIKEALGDGSIPLETL